MTDVFCKEKRSQIMSNIRSWDTEPELSVQKPLTGMKKNYRTHPKDVFGCPDIVGKKKKVAVFLDGCFWHGCRKCRSIPESNREFWQNKIDYNKKRRRKVKSELKKQGWTVLEFWEHDIRKNPETVAKKIAENL